MSLATKLRAFEKRLADASAQVGVADSVRVLIVRSEVIDCIVTNIGSPWSTLRRIVSTQRRPNDTDETLAARHDIDVLAAATRWKAAAGKSTVRKA